MSPSLQVSPFPSKGSLPDRPHRPADPLTDGLDDNEVFEPTYPDWARLCARHPALARASGYPMSEPIPPKHMTIEEVARLLATFRHPELGPIIRDGVNMLLAESFARAMTATVNAALSGRRNGNE